MTKDMLIMNALIFFYVLQRFSEMIISKDNETWLKAHHDAYELSPKESLLMKLFHISWFIALIIEANIQKSFQSPSVSLLIYIILAVSLTVRIHTMTKLKRFWTIKVLSLNSPQIVVDGLYKYIRHPNYFIVIIELLFIPLLFKAYWTMGVFSLLNLYVVSNRINFEEKSLMQHPEYLKHFNNKKRFIPYIFLLCFCSFPLHATEIKIHSNSYNDAKKSENYIKFQSQSTKLGFITTSFDGFAKDYTVSYDKKSDIISKIDVVLSVLGLDTDVGSRNEKMHSEIMDAKNFPNIKVTFPEAVTLNSGEQTVNVIFTIKDKQITRSVVLNSVKKETKWVVSGKTQFGLKEAGLPDPSIAIAKVRDQFDLEFVMTLND